MGDDKTGQTTVIYTRLSLDKTGAGLGVERQEQECRELAARLGLTVVAVYSDNDISATTGERRPGFEALLASQPQSITVWHTDRLCRVAKDLERVIDLEVPVYAVTAGNLDLATPAGRAVARTVTAWACYESEQKAERQKAAAKQRARQGRPWWPKRPFGFELDGTHREQEAQALRQTYEDLLRGVPLAVLARRLNDAGLLTNRGRPWTGMTLRPVLLNPRNAGIRAYHGQEVGPAAWAAIVDEDTFRAAVDLLTDPARYNGGGGRTAQNLLTGIAVCGVCGAPVKAMVRKGYRQYSCRKRYCVSHRIAETDTFVSDQIKKFLYRQDVYEIFDDGDNARRAEAKKKANELQTQLDEAIAEFNALRLSARTLSQIEASLRPQIEEQLRLARSAAIPKKIVEVVHYPEMWEDTLDLDLRREMVRSFFTVELLPIGRGVRRYDPARFVRLTSPRTGRVWNPELDEFETVELSTDTITIDDLNTGNVRSGNPEQISPSVTEPFTESYVSAANAAQPVVDPWSAARLTSHNATISNLTA